MGPAPLVLVSRTGETAGTRPRWERGPTHRVPQFLEHWSRGRFIVIALLLLGATIGFAYLEPWVAIAFVPVGFLTVVGVHDIFQTRHTILRNYPILGHLRFWAESLRPELRQYFVESDSEANPISRENRSIVYQRAKAMLETHPFGTERQVYDSGYEWLAHSIDPVEPSDGAARIEIGAGTCAQPYSASLLNISAMSFGSLSGKAILALNEGARRAGFYHNTGEGGVSRFHLEPGGDLVWQIGTGYFGCRAGDGTFDRDQFRAVATGEDAIRMIEIKLSQGAKPSHGGILPAGKVTKEIAEARGVAIGETVVSPPRHSAFHGPVGLLELVTELRELSGGKPIGFKLCVGRPIELVAIVKAMLETGMAPDFITVDGAEGGTGAAPLEFTNSVGMPLDDGLCFVDNVLRGAGVRDRLRVISAGKITTGFHLLRHLALGADLCNAARAFMFAVGCIQALKCDTNKCPTGVTTHDPRYTQGLVVEDKASRVASFHARTVESLLELAGAAGFERPGDVPRDHIYRRVSHARVCRLDEVYPSIPDGAMLAGDAPETYQRLWDAAP